MSQTVQLNLLNVVHRVDGGNHTPKGYWEIEDGPESEAHYVIGTSDQHCSVSQPKQNDKEEKSE